MNISLSLHPCLINPPVTRSLIVTTLLGSSLSYCFLTDRKTNYTAQATKRWGKCIKHMVSFQLIYFVFLMINIRRQGRKHVKRYSRCNSAARDKAVIMRFPRCLDFPPLLVAVFPAPMNLWIIDYWLLYVRVGWEYDRYSTLLRWGWFNQGRIWRLVWSWTGEEVWRNRNQGKGFILKIQCFFRK